MSVPKLLWKTLISYSIAFSAGATAERISQALRIPLSHGERTVYVRGFLFDLVAVVQLQGVQN